MEKYNNSKLKVFINTRANNIIIIIHYYYLLLLLLLSLLLYFSGVFYSNHLQYIFR